MTEQGRPSVPPTETATEARRMAGIVLVRIATEPGEEAHVARDLSGILGTKGSGDLWRIELGRLIAALVAGGLVERKGSRLDPTAQGISAVAEFLELKKSLPASWEAARDIQLVAKALDLAAAPASRLKLLRKPDGLRALIVTRHWQLRIKGIPTAQRLRSALAQKALERAFGNQGSSGPTEKPSLPAKSARLLASKMSASGREFGSDARLVAALAAEAVGSRRSDFKSLQLAVLRQFLGRADGQSVPRRAQRRLAKKADARAEANSGAPPTIATPPTRPAPATPISSTPVTADEGRPTPVSFAEAVLAATSETAEGWAGNRKSFISKVWAVIRERHAAWSLTEIEFKCMLTEAHRTGLVTLANADLKDKRSQQELADSAVVYKNTVWHYVRAAD